LKLTYDARLPNFALTFNLRRYTCGRTEKVKAPSVEKASASSDASGGSSGAAPLAGVALVAAAGAAYALGGKKEEEEVQTER
jgi:hypothetical protein